MPEASSTNTQVESCPIKPVQADNPACEVNLLEQQSDSGITLSPGASSNTSYGRLYCELLAEDETLMNLSFIEEVCEAAHDESLALLPFLPTGGSERPWQLIFCREGKRAANAYIYPPLKLLLVVTHAHSALIHPPLPLPASEFPAVLEAYRLKLEEAFERYIRDLCDRAACLADLFQANAKARYSTSVFSRFVSPAAAAATTNTTTTTTAAAVNQLISAEGAVRDAEAAHQAAAETATDEAAAGAAAAPAAAAADPGAASAAGGAAAGETRTGTTTEEAAAVGVSAADGETAGAAPLPGSSAAAGAVDAGAAAPTAGPSAATVRTTAGANFAPPPCPTRVFLFLKGGEKEGDTQDPGPFAKLTAVVSARRVNVESCWALAWTELWEIYFSLQTRRLVVEGDVRIHSHSCEDWNAQVSYRRRFRIGSCRSSPPPAAAAAGASSFGAAADAGEGQQNDHEDGQAAREEEDGLYVKHCEHIANPEALTEQILKFIKLKNFEIVKEQEFFRYAYAPLMLKRLRRLLSLTGERFDWQQQQIHLQPRQQI